MPERPLLAVHRTGAGYAAHCSTHGYITIWSWPLLANLDLLGHAAHHHTHPLPAAPPSA